MASMDHPLPTAGRRHGLSVLFAMIAVFLGCSASEQPTKAKAPPIAQNTAGRQIAFPGAKGYGALSKGGRGGQIIYVDSLADRGPGTFRACVEASMPRVCVFRVSGVIRFLSRPPVISNPYLTIAGQTAPGGGITLAHSGGVNGLTPLLFKHAHDVIVRHIRVRNDRIGGSREGEDSITIESSRNVIIDHVSASWARDELINGFADTNNVTISWSIFAEGIPKHDKCALLASDPVGPQNLSFVDNVCAHNGDRNPDINFTPGSCVEVVNNVLYDADSQFAEVWESYGGTPVAIVGNVFQKGPSTSSGARGIDREIIGSKGNAAIYYYDNSFRGEFLHISPKVVTVSRDLPACPLTFKPLSADQAFEQVLDHAGAFPRDSFDARIVSDVRNRTGRIIREPGQIPPVAGGAPYPDADHDGMDDNWERAHGADPTKWDPWGDANGDGVLNLDTFLADLSDELIARSGSASSLGATAQ